MAIAKAGFAHVGIEGSANGNSASIGKDAAVENLGDVLELAIINPMVGPIRHILSAYRTTR